MKLINYIILAVSLGWISCGPQFESIVVRYEIPYGSKYYRIDGVEAKLEKKEGKTPGIAVAEPRYLQVTATGNPAENDHAVTMALAGKWQKAADKWQAILKKNPNDTAALNNRGVALSILGRHNEALALFAKCMQIKDRDVYIYHYQATVNLDTKYTPVVKPESFAGPKPKPGERAGR